MRVRLRRYFNVLEVSGADNLPARFVTDLKEKLEYTKKVFITKREAYRDDNGNWVRFSFQRHTCLTPTESGDLRCSFGFYDRILAAIKQHKLELDYRDLTPWARDRAETMTFNWSLIDGLNQRGELVFRDTQREAVQALVANERGYIVCPPAWGKTIPAVAIACGFNKARVAVVEPTLTLLNKTHRNLLQFLPDVGRVGGGRKTYGRVSVVSADSLHLVDDRDVYVVDEPHLCMSDTRSAKLMAVSRQANMYGLTATPDGRLDGADIRLESIFGAERFRISWAETNRLGLNVPITVVWHRFDTRVLPVDDDADDVSFRRYGIWEHDRRNRFVARVAGIYPPDEQTLILVDTVHHAAHLLQHLPEYEIACSEASAIKLKGRKYADILPRGYRPPDRKRLEALEVAFASGVCKKVIATTVWDTGADFPNLAAVIRANARGANKQKDEQVPGRVARVVEGKDCGYVHDIVDGWSKRLCGSAKGRSGQYGSRSWQQLEERRGDFIPISRDLFRPS